MEVTENTAQQTDNKSRGVFVPADVLRIFGAEFLDGKYCKAWVMEKLHGDQSREGAYPPFCPGCDTPLPGRMLQSFWDCKRVKCDSCGKYFTALTGTFLSGCHFSFREIVLLAFLLALGITDKQISPTLKISPENVRLWRHRFEAIDQVQKIKAVE